MRLPGGIGAFTSGYGAIAKWSGDFAQPIRAGDAIGIGTTYDFALGGANTRISRRGRPAIGDGNDRCAVLSRNLRGFVDRSVINDDYFVWPVVYLFA